MWIMLGLKRSLFHGSSLVELRMQSVSPFSTAAKATRTPTTTPMIQQWRKSLATGWKLMSICSSLPMRQQPHHHSMPTATSAPPLHPFPRNKTTAIPDKVMVEEDSPHDSNWASHMEKDPNQGGGGGEDGADEELPRTSVLLALTDRVGVLHDVLRYFWKYNVNICRIESRPLGVRKKSTSTSRNIAATASAASADPGKEYRSFDFFVDFEGSTDDANVRQLLQDLGGLTDQLLLLDAKSVHWFPRHISELDRVAHRTLDAGVDLQSTDHPGFHDPVYRSRRGALAQLSAQHTWDQPIAHVTYTPEETSVWNAVWHQMEPLWDLYACKEYRSALHEMSLNCGYSQDTIPQQQSISEYLQRRTGFRMRPVPGLLSSRDFLNGLAFRVFFCTQYMRHHSQPLYTPEPDLCHELLGHAPMLADPDFADFSQEIGLASLGASDDEVTKLAHCYWHSVEFGLCNENGVKKAYGAGLLSSYGELAYACSQDKKDGTEAPKILPWDPEIASKQEFPITTYQPIYFLADSLSDAKHKMRHYCENLPRPFFALYSAQTNSVHIDRPVKRNKGVPV